MVILEYRCNKCGKSFKVKRSTALNKHRLWKNLCLIKDTEVKKHFDIYHPNDDYISVFPIPTNHIGWQKSLEIHEKLGINILYGLFFRKMRDGSIKFVH